MQQSPVLDFDTLQAAKASFVLKMSDTATNAKAAAAADEAGKVKFLLCYIKQCNPGTVSITCPTTTISQAHVARSIGRPSPKSATSRALMATRQREQRKLSDREILR